MDATGLSNFKGRAKPNFAKKAGVDLEMIYVASPNFSDKASEEKDKFKYIIIHHTATSRMQDEDGNFVSLKVLTDPNSQNPVSAHYLILREINGESKIVILVDDDKKAWHAGVSKWLHDNNLNNYSIGIEINNDGITELFSDAQMASLVALLSCLKKVYEINPFNILGHAEIAPNRKIDPSDYFDWKILADYGIAYFPFNEGNSNILCKIGDQGKIVENIQNLLQLWGYRYFDVDGVFDERTKLVIESFQRKYAPYEYRNDELRGCWTHNDDVKMQELLTARKDYYNGDLKIEVNFEKIKNNPMNEFFHPHEEILIAMNINIHDEL